MLLFACSMISDKRGWGSEVMKIATGPLMPCGTTHWSSGSATENGRPPISIWHVMFCSRYSESVYGRKNVTHCGGHVAVESG